MPPTKKPEPEFVERRQAMRRETDSAVAVATAAAAALSGAVRQFGEDIQVLKSTDVRRRRILKVLGVSVAFDIALSIALGWVGVTAKTASDTAIRATSSSKVAANQQAAACQANNEAKASQRKLWDFLFTFPPPPDETPEARKQRLETTPVFKSYIADSTTLEDCTKIAKNDQQRSTD